MQRFYQALKSMNKLIVCSLLLLLVACGKEPTTGAVEIKFDRDACERCRMLISDPYHAAQVRGGERHQVYKFDDIGGAVIWLAEQPWQDDPQTEMWVTEHTSGEWIDAKQAWYVRETHTPMNYGYSAELEKTANAVDYATMVVGVMAIERKLQSK